MKNKKKELEELKKEIEYLYSKTFSNAYRQRAGMRKRINFIADRIVELEKEIEN